MQKVFLERNSIVDGELCITGGDAHHIRDVLRMRPGEQLLVSCGDEWEYTCEITESDKEEIRARVIDAQRPGKELPCRVTLLQCLPKGDKMETVIQKAVELGAAEIVPVASRRCVVKLDEKKAEARVRRWNTIAASAAAQAKRMIVPQVHAVLSLSEALRYARSGAILPREEQPVLLLPYEHAEGMARTRQIVGGIRPGQPVAVLVGPEGGFDEEEVRQAREEGFEPITLGRRILRTETAGLATLSMLVYVLDE